MPVQLRPTQQWYNILQTMSLDGWLWKISNNDPIDSRDVQSTYCTFWKYINGRYVGAFSRKDAGDEDTAVREAAQRALQEENRTLQGL